MKTHPNAVAAREQRQHLIQERKERKAFVEAVQKKFNLQFVHVRTERFMAECEDARFATHGGATVAYVPTNVQTQSDTFQMSIALCHPKELYNREIGLYYAARNFAEGHSITLRRPSKDVHYAQFIKETFCGVAE